MKMILTICGALILVCCHPTIRDRVHVPSPPPVTTNETMPVRTPEPKVPVDGPPPALTTKTDPEMTVPAVKNVAKVVAEINEQLQDIFFAYDRSNLTPEAVSALSTDARLLAPVFDEVPEVKLTVEGHCDERGSAEYNIALGEQRAAQTAAMLRSLGLPAAKIETISYGKERPQCEEPRESCWRKNRRAHLVLSMPAIGATLP